MLLSWFSNSMYLDSLLFRCVSYASFCSSEDIWDDRDSNDDISWVFFVYNYLFFDDNSV